jgi:hypothetical protein
VQAGVCPLLVLMRRLGNSRVKENSYQGVMQKNNCSSAITSWLVVLSIKKNGTHLATHPELKYIGYHY